MKKEELIKIGFRHRYKPSLKKIDEFSLSYNNLIGKGNLISINLVFIHSILEWKIDNIIFEGDLALKLLKENLNHYELKDVIEFVLKFPIQTF